MFGRCFRESRSRHSSRPSGVTSRGPLVPCTFSRGPSRVGSCRAYGSESVKVKCLKTCDKIVRISICAKFFPRHSRGAYVKGEKRAEEGFAPWNALPCHISSSSNARSGLKTSTSGPQRTGLRCRIQLDLHEGALR